MITFLFLCLVIGCTINYVYSAAKNNPQTSSIIREWLMKHLNK